MSRRDTPRWVRAEDALLLALDCTATPAGSVRAVYRLLALPTFHRPCCVQVTLHEEAHYVRLAVLTEGAHAITSSAWAGTTTAELEDAILAGMLATRDFEAPIDLDRDWLARQPTPTVNPDDEAARDGLSLRLDLLDGRAISTISAQLAGVQHSPVLAEWLEFFLGFGRMPTVPPALATAFGDVASYLP